MKKRTSFSYFDNCKICTAMEMADKRGLDLSSEELMQAFRDQAQKPEDAKE